LLRIRSIFSRAALDDFVEFPSIQPYPPTFWAIVDLNGLSLAHDEVDPAKWAKKAVAFLTDSLGSF
jgi:hypothetical protein